MDLKNAIEHIKRTDAIMAKIITAVGVCTLKPMENYFLALTESIISQQLSVKAAATIFGRFLAIYTEYRKKGQLPTPLTVLNTPDELFRQAGLSKQKMSYLKNLAEKFQTGVIIPEKLTAMPDEEIIEQLTQVKGIGRWTVEMFLIFALNRPDVLPVDDLGFRKAIKLQYCFSEMPTAEEVRRIAERWRPYRTIATWYLWASLDNVPVQQA